ALDWSYKGQRRTGSSSGATSTSMLRAAPGLRRIQPSSFESEHHLVDRGWGDAEMPLKVSLGRRPAEGAYICVDEGQILTLLRRETWGRQRRHRYIISAGVMCGKHPSASTRAPPLSVYRRRIRSSRGSQGGPEHGRRVSALWLAGAATNSGNSAVRSAAAAEADARSGQGRSSRAVPRDRGRRRGHAGAFRSREYRRLARARPRSRAVLPRDADRGTARGGLLRDR